jgi:hypothetical protein
LPTSSPELLDAIVLEAADESSLWRDCTLPAHERELVAVFSPLAEQRFRLGLETIYEAYLVHFGRPRLFASTDRDTALLLGDYLFAHGLVRIAALGETQSVADLAELISLCGQLRAEDRPGDGAAWAATAALLGTGALDEARAALRLAGDPGPLERDAREAAGDAAVERALDAHAGRVG